MEIVRPERPSADLALHFAIGPAYDLVISLASATDPDRYELSAAWTRSVRQALPTAARRDLTYFFGDPLSLGVGAVQLIPDLSDAEIETFLRRLDDIDPAELVAALLSRGASTAAVRPAVRRLARGKTLAQQDEALVSQHLGGLKAETRRRFKAILQDPGGVRRRYSAVLHAHADGWFAEHYVDVLPVLQQRVKQGRRSIGKLPTKEVIARVTGGFTLQNAAARSVLLVPSYYAAPFVFVVGDRKDVVLVYGARPAARAAAAPLDIQTVRVLKALSDETRLRLLQLVAERPLYGQQLADALGVSHPTISHHMAQLRIAGLTRTELAEDGSKTYSVRPETIDEVCAELRSAFVEPRLRSVETR